MKKIKYLVPEMDTIKMQSNQTILAGSGDGIGSGQEFGGEGGTDIPL